MDTYLFVYGTLMQAADNEFSRILQQHTSFFGKGYLFAKKYDLGAYPGIKLDPTKQHKTNGELYKIIGSKELLFENLDFYEGYISEVSSENLFIRKLETVYLEKEKITAWVYEYAKTI